MRSSILILIPLLSITACSLPGRKEKEAAQLAKTYCGSCHLFTEANLLDKRTWKDAVLPSMARKLGIDPVFETTLPEQDNMITVEQWKKILAYYMSNAPDTMPAQGRPAIKAFTTMFSVKKREVSQGKFPSTAYIKIDEGNHRIYASNTFDSALDVYDEDLRRLAQSRIRATPVDIDFTSLTGSGKRNGVLTDIGIMNPNDRSTGSAFSFTMDAHGNLTHMARLFGNLPRPVQVIQCDLDADGQYDYLVCGFGNAEGALFWMKGKGTGFEKRILIPLPGAIAAYVEDINKDGLPDILVLMAQAHEGVFLFMNKGKGAFTSKKLLGFPPVYGSSFLEFTDFNKDGYKDLLYTCGDNADYSSRALKYYHGIYIYVNDGKNNFSQKYFFPIHGSYKALARDFDKDGDMDIAAISFFPDTKNQPQESFVYLEQNAAFHFTPYTIPDFNAGNWMTMDAGDVDGDGYEDIVLGGLIPPVDYSIEAWKKSGRQKTAVLLLHNQSNIMNSK